MSIGTELQWLERGAGVCALPDRAIVAVTGDDAHEWLQGQITNQLEGAKAGDSVYGFVLTLKGRVLADAWVLLREEDAWLDVPKTQVEALLERLDRYIIMEDVDLEPRHDLRVITAQGPQADAVATNGWPSNRLGTGGRVWVVAENDAAAALRRMAERAGQVGGGELSPEGWAHTHVARGRPRFGTDFGDNTYPQETGLTAVAVSFNKGCYIGQETVVMLENRGKAPKVLWRLEVEGPEPPAPGTRLTKDDVEVGKLTSAVQEGPCSLALGYIKRGHEVDQGSGWCAGRRAARPLGPVSTGPAVQGR